MNQNKTKRNETQVWFNMSWVRLPPVTLSLHLCHHVIEFHTGQRALILPPAVKLTVHLAINSGSLRPGL